MAGKHAGAMDSPANNEGYHKIFHTRGKAASWCEWCVRAGWIRVNYMNRRR